MFASTLFADENDVSDFDRQIQNLLRIGRADEAAAILETALGELGKAGHPVAAHCLACPIESVEIVGWDALAKRIADLDRPHAPIAALGIDICRTGHNRLEPDADGCLAPLLETNYYTDTAFPFTTASLDALLGGYGPSGAEWQGTMTEIDKLLAVRGLDRIYGLVFPLVESIATNPEPEPLESDAMRLGSAFVAVRLHQAVARAIRQHGLPRSLVVIVGSNESYPFYDAPVFDFRGSRQFVIVPTEPEPDEVQPADVSANDLPGPAGPDEGATVDEGAVALLLSFPQASHDDKSQADALSAAVGNTDRVVQISGAALRHRLGQLQAAENATNQPVPATGGGLLRRLFAR